MAHIQRVVVLIDMDCFYCQVEEKLNPDLEGKPIAVVQYNGGIIAVNYPARDKGVTRHMRGKEAKVKCPDIVLAKVPQVRGKADLSKYRDAGQTVADVLQTFTNLLERASVDEAYLDVTDIVLKRMEDGIEQISIDKFRNTYVVGCDIKDFLFNITNHPEYSDSNFKLCLGAMIAEEVRAEVFKRTGYKCSAGIAHNKILAKLVCGLNKPNKQTVIPHDSIPKFFETLPLTKVRNLGGKFGNSLTEELCISKMGELVKFSEKQLVDKFGKKNGCPLDLTCSELQTFLAQKEIPIAQCTTMQSKYPDIYNSSEYVNIFTNPDIWPKSWLYNIARGIDFDPVVTRLISKSIGCCKNFPGRTALRTHEAVQHWINELATEISERLKKDLEDNNRRAKQMIISFGQQCNGNSISNSRTHRLSSYEQSQISQDAVEVVRKACQKSDGSYFVTFLGISVSNFHDQKNIVDISSFFKKTTELPTWKQESEEIVSKNLEIEEVSVPDSVLKQVENSYERENSDEEIIDGGNDSIYSACTEELEEDPTSYIYFEDIYPEFVSSQPIESDQHTNEAETSISTDLDHKKELETIRKSSRSFFCKYFENVSENNQTPDAEMLEPELEEFDIGQEQINKSHRNETNISVDEDSGNTNIAEEKRKSQESDHRTTPGIKRKASEVSLLNYFPKSEEPNENYCPECKKNIPFEEILDHSDYHMAKNLQAELNKSISVNPVPLKGTVKVNPKNKKGASMFIPNFFKPV